MSVLPENQSATHSPNNATEGATHDTNGQPQTGNVDMERELRAANATRIEHLRPLDEVPPTQTQSNTSELEDIANVGQLLHTDASRRSRSSRTKKRARSHYTRRVSFHQPQQLLSQSSDNYLPWSAYMKLALSGDVL
jgi:hypothetical protein